MTTPLLEIQHLTKVYRRGVRANDDISFHVDAGEVVGLLGHNGAGKTTLLNQVIGLARPTEGAIRVDGRDAVADPDLARTLCSFQPQTQAPLDSVTPRQAVELAARIRGAGRREARQRAGALLAALDIEAWADQIGDQLSGGVKRLTAFAMAAARPGRLVMFDEPTNDVDPVRRRLLWQQVRELADAGCAVVLVTHNVVEAERAVERLVILDKGKVVGEGTPAQLRGDDGDRLRLELVALDNAAALALSEELTADRPTVLGRRLVVTIAAGDAGRAIARAQDERTAGRIEEFSIVPVSLEDVYIRLVSPAGTEEQKRGIEDAALVS
ncbi:ABC transporter ATP-binding protein [Flindersiella endophytica]